MQDTELTSSGSPLSKIPAVAQVVHPLAHSTCSSTAPSYVPSLISSHVLATALCCTQPSLLTATFHPFHASRSLLLSFPWHMRRCSPLQKRSHVSPCLLYVLMCLSFDSPKGILLCFFFFVFLHDWVEACWGQSPSSCSLPCCEVPAQISSFLPLDGPSELPWNPCNLEAIGAFLGGFHFFQQSLCWFCRLYAHKSIHRESWLCWYIPQAAQHALGSLYTSLPTCCPMCGFFKATRT